MSASIHIIGLDHFLQNLDRTTVTEEGGRSEEQQKRDFAVLVENRIAQRNTNLICEEAKLDCKCLGEVLAEAHGCGYTNITMPWNERTAAGIGRDYDNEEATRDEAYTAFERYMVGKIKESLTAESSVLVLCGAVHVKGLSVMLEQAGHDVSSESVVDRFSPPVEVGGEYLGSWTDL